MLGNLNRRLEKLEKQTLRYPQQVIPIIEIVITNREQLRHFREHPDEILPACKVLIPDNGRDNYKDIRMT